MWIDNENVNVLYATWDARTSYGNARTRIKENIPFCKNKICQVQ